MPSSGIQLLLHSLEHLLLLLLYCVRRPRGVIARALSVCDVYTAVRLTTDASYNVSPFYLMLD